MFAVKTCAAVIPCLNERAGVAALVAALRQQLPRVMVVDDGSVDDTAARAGVAGATVLRHERNFGKGAALRTGLSQARRQGFDWAVTLDGDGQHAPDDLPVFLQRAEQTGARLIIGDRMHQARAIPWLRRQVNRWMSRQLSRRAGRRLPDTQCGFRLVHLETWATLSLSTEHFEIESEMLMAFLAARHPVEFVPIRVIGRGRRSHIRPLADSLRWWKWWHQLNHPGSGYAPAGSPMRVTLQATAQAPVPPG
jgi:glycosyltransferase involved in cell wall biosynthesis